MAAFVSVAEFRAQNSQFLRALKQNRASLDRQEKSVRGLSRSLRAAHGRTSGFASAQGLLDSALAKTTAGVVAGAAALGLFAGHGAQTATELNKVRLATGLASEEVQRWYAAFGRLGFEVDEAQEILVGAASLIRRAYDDPGIKEAVDGLGLRTQSVSQVLEDVLRLARTPGTNQEHLFTILTELALSSEKQWASFFSAAASGFSGLSDDAKGFARLNVRLSAQQIAQANALARATAGWRQELAGLATVVLSELAPYLVPVLREAERRLPRIEQVLRSGFRAGGEAVLWVAGNLDGLLATAKLLSGVWLANRFFALSATGWDLVRTAVGRASLAGLTATKVFRAVGKAVGRAFVVGGLLEFSDDLLRLLAAASEWLGGQLPSSMTRAQAALAASAQGMRAAADVVDDFNPSKLAAEINAAFAGTDQIDRFQAAVDRALRPRQPLGLDIRRPEGAIEILPPLPPDRIVALELINARLTATDRLLFKLRTRAQDFARTLSHDLFDGILEVVGGARTLNDVLRQTLKSLALTALQAAILTPAQAALTNFFSGFSPLALPGRAAGGPVDAQKPVVVGERGPEVFWPGSPGQIVSNKQLKAALAGLSLGAPAPQTPARPGDAQQLKAALAGLSLGAPLPQTPARPGDAQQLKAALAGLSLGAPAPQTPARPGDAQQLKAALAGLSLGAPLPQTPARPGDAQQLKAALAGLPRRAAGGAVGREPVVVGEDGREVFWPSQPGQIVPNDQLKRALAGGNQGQIIVNAPFAPVIHDASPEQVHTVIESLYPDWLARTKKALSIDLGRSGDSLRQAIRGL